MTAPDVIAGAPVRCHRCSKVLGETSVALELVCITKEREIKDLIKTPRDTWICRCGWLNIFRRAA